MQSQVSCLTSLVATISIVSSKIVHRPRFSNYHLPWACSVVHTDGSFISACTIFDADKVIASVDSFNQKVRGKKTMYFADIENVLVYAGSNLMDPEKMKPWATPEHQARKVVRLKIPTGRGEDGKWKQASTPNITDLSSVEYDHYGVAYNLGFLVLDRPFEFNAYVKPILVPGSLLSKTKDFIKRNERKIKLPTGSCITYSWCEKNNKMQLHLVTYLYKEKCLDVFCGWNISTCNVFPTKQYHACFKSVTYADVCPSARGAALFCKEFENSVFAILTAAPSCGLRRMPGVYTTLPTVIAVYEALFTKFDQGSRPKYDPLGQPQPYSPFG